MKKGLIYLPFVAFSFLALTSCQDDISLSSDVPSSTECVTEEEEVAVRQSEDAVNYEELMNVINALNAHKSRAAAEYTVKAINDSLGEPAMYVVNFGLGDGWMIISASKNLVPLLAYSNEGHFSLDESIVPEGLDLWLSGIKATVANPELVHPDSIAVAQRAWEVYLSKPTVLSRSSSVFEEQHKNEYGDILDYITSEELAELEQMVSDSISAWNSYGWSVTPLGWSDFEEDQDLYNELCSGLIYYKYLPNIDEFVFKIGKSGGQTSESVLVKSTWRQQYSYNQSFPATESGSKEHALVGCAPLAMGQIMRYYEYPTTYDWSSMPLHYATKTTSDFLLEIAEQAHAKYKDDGTEVYPDDIKSTLEHYGYDVYGFNVLKSNSKPTIPALYMSDLIDEDGEVAGHAWISGGSGCTKTWSSVEIYTFTERRHLDKGKTVSSTTTTINTTYMIWGWSTSYNGFYTYRNIHPSGYTVDGDIEYLDIVKP